MKIAVVGTGYVGLSNAVLLAIFRRNPKWVGMYRLVMKAGSDYFSSSAILGIMNAYQSERH